MQFASFGFGRSPQAIDKVVCKSANTEGPTSISCSPLSLAIISVLGRGHKIKDPKPHRLYIRCSRGDECAFRVNALLVDGVGLRILKSRSTTVRVARCGKGK